MMFCLFCLTKMSIFDVDCRYDVGDLTRHYKCRCGVRVSVDYVNFQPVKYTWRVPQKYKKVVKK